MEDTRTEETRKLVCLKDSEIGLIGMTLLVHHVAPELVDRLDRLIEPSNYTKTALLVDDLNREQLIDFIVDCEIHGLNDFDHNDKVRLFRRGLIGYESLTNWELVELYKNQYKEE